MIIRFQSFFGIISIIFFIVSCATPSGNWSGGRNPASVDFPEYDRGPNPEDPMQKELVEIIQDLPFLPGISEQLQVLIGNSRGQKMRPDFGGMPLRGFLEPNSISVIVIGQDGTHIAEGANRPGIAGFGGRVQDMLLHFGILEGVFFTNLYVNTIAGQYGSRSTPVVQDGKTINYQNVIENRQWLMTHEGPYGEWRNRFLSWIVRNNRDSLRMVMMLGQAGKDAGSSFVNYLGGEVGPRSNVGTGAQFDVPIFKMVGAGGNNEFAVPLTAKNEDVAEVLKKDKKIRDAVVAHLEEGLKTAQDKAIKAADDLAAGKISKRQHDTIAAMVNVWQMRLGVLDKPFDYRDGDFKTLEGVSTYVAQYLITKNPKEAIANMVFSNGGPNGSGVLRPEQFGGWDIRTMKVNGKDTRSIAGLKIPCAGSKVGACASSTHVTAPDVVFVGAPHPTALSMGEQQRPGSAAKSVEAELIAPLREEQKRGWKPPQPEKGLSSAFLEGNTPYKYGRGVIPPSHGDPGITAMRLLPVSTAQRDGSHMIIIGTRDGVVLDQARIQNMMIDTPSNEALLKSHNVLTSRPRFTEWLYEYDRGPSQMFSDLLFKSRELDPQSVLVPKAAHEKQFRDAYKKFSAKAKDDADREEAYLDAVNDVFADFGIDAFNFKSHPEAGFFGHYRGTFETPKVFILADPHGYDSFITSKAATGARGQYLHGLMRDFGIDDQYLVLSTVPAMMDGATTEEWNGALESTKKYRTDLVTAIMKMRPSLVMADGKFAAQELRSLGVKNFIEIKQAQDPATGIKDAGAKIASSGTFKGSPTGQRVDIPRSHLTWIARVWEGTSGDRVITATDIGNKGKAFAIVAPDWARNAKSYFTADEQKVLKEMINRLAKNGEPMPKEDVTSFAKRRQSCRSEAESNSKGVCKLPSSVSFPGTLPDTGSF